MDYELESLKRRLIADPGNPYIQQRIQSLSERLGLVIKECEAIPSLLVNDYVLSGNAKFAIQWTEGDKPQHLNYEVHQHVVKKGRKVVKRYPKWNVWYKLATQEWQFLMIILRGKEGITVDNFAKYGKNHDKIMDHFLAMLDGDTTYKVYHDGNCGQCGRNLEHPESIRRGIGPICYAERTKEERASL